MFVFNSSFRAPRGCPRQTRTHRPRTIQSYAIASCLTLFAPPTLAQTASPPPDPNTPPAAGDASIDELLNRVLENLRITESGQPDAAQAVKSIQQDLTAVNQRDPANARAQYYYARYLAVVGKGADAINPLQEWTKTPQGRSDWEAHFILGKLYGDGRYWSLAKPILEKALQLNPREPRILVELARCALNMRRPKDAVQHTRQAINLLGADVSAPLYVLLGQALTMGNQLDDADRAARYAIELAEAGIQRQGSTPTTLSSLNDALGLALDIKQAQINATPSSSAPYLELVKLLQKRAGVAERMGLSQALQAAMKGVEIAGDRPPEDLLLEIVHLYGRLDQPEKAADALDRTLNLYPDSTEANRLKHDMASGS